MGHSLWVHRAAPFVDPGKFSRFSWNLLSNQSGKYFKVYRKTPWTCEQFSKNKGSKYFKVTWLPTQKKDSFQFWSFVECFEYLELQKFLAPGILRPLFGVNFRSTSGSIYTYSNCTRIPGWHNENLRIMIRTILASTGELCFMLTLLRIRDLRMVSIWLEYGRSVDLCLGWFSFHFNKMIPK